MYLLDDFNINNLLHYDTPLPPYEFLDSAKHLITFISLLSSPYPAA